MYWLGYLSLLPYKTIQGVAGCYQCSATEGWMQLLRFTVCMWNVVTLTVIEVPLQSRYNIVQHLFFAYKGEAAVDISRPKDRRTGFALLRNEGLKERTLCFAKNKRRVRSGASMEAAP